jgi:hypothetical protein
MEDNKKNLPKEEPKDQPLKEKKASVETTSTNLGEDKEIGIESKSTGIDNDSSNQSEKLKSDIVLTEELKSKIKELFKGDFDDSVQKQKEEIKKEGQEIKKDFLTIFGLFASFVTFLSIEVQVFKNKDNVFELIGICSISLSFVMFFALIINDIAKDKSEWSDFKTPTYLFNLIFLVIGIIFLSIGGISPTARIDALENKNISDSIEVNLLELNIKQLTNKVEYLDSINSISKETVVIAPIAKKSNAKKE